MHSMLRVISLLLIFLVTVAACTTTAVAPTSTPSARQQAVEAAPSDRVELASDRYQLLMFYSPL